MHITLEADYAVRIVHALATKGSRMDAKTIAGQTGVTLRFSLKILRKLVGAGIVRSYKGTQGGYEVAKPVSEITLNDVIQTVEGPFVLSRCLREDYSCANSSGDCECRFQKIYDNISKDVQSKLAAITFEQLI